MKTKKKSIITLGIISCLCLMLIIGIFLSTPSVVDYAEAAPTAPTNINTSWAQEGETIWDNGTKVAFNTIAPNQYRSTATEDGTESRPYLIDNADDFGAFLYEISASGVIHTGKYFKITNDIDLGQYYLKHTAYSNSITNFGGVLDGNDKTLSNIFISSSYAETGIFNTLTGTVKNLNINNAVVSSASGSSVGVLAGKLLGGGFLDGIHIINSTVTATANGAELGGIVGCSIHSAGEDVSIINSSVRNSTITGNTSVGGILGIYSPVTSAGETSNFNITRCLSYDNQINGANKVGGIVGGFRGLYVDNTQYAMATISRCYNYSTVTASNTCAGGIVGGIAVGSSPMSECTYAQFTISECGNVGNITAGSFAGGISGIVFCEVALTDNRVIESCFNQGVITVGTISTAPLLGNLQYYYPINDACYVATAITFRTASAYNGGDEKICDIKSSYNTGDIILPENKSGLKTTGGHGGESDNTGVYSLKPSENIYHKIYPTSASAFYKNETQLRELVSTLGTTYFEQTNGYPILKNIDQDWYYKPTVTVGRVYSDTETSGSVWVGTPVTNIPTVDLTYDISSITDNAYAKLYYAEKAGTTAQTADNIIKNDTTVYIKYQVPISISGNGNNVNINKWQGEQLALTDFNANVTLQKTNNTISGLVGQTLPLTVIDPASYTIAYTPISYRVAFMNGASALKTQNYSHNYALKATDFPSVTANAGYIVKWFDEQIGGNEYTAGSTITGALTLYVRQIASTNTPYSVKHYQESLTQSGGDGRIQQDGVWYELAETQNKTGTTDEQTQATANVYTGFTTNSFSQATINGNGETIINIYYARNSYTVTIISATGQTNSVSKKYQETLKSSDISVYAGCGTSLGSKYFLNWHVTGGTVSTNAFAGGNITIENSLSLSVNAETIAVTAISVNSLTHKTAYHLEDTLDVRNLTISVTYNHATVNTPASVAVTVAMVTGFNTDVVGNNKAATISYQGQTTTLNYSVSEELFNLTFMSDGSQYGDIVEVSEDVLLSEHFPAANPTKTGSNWDTRYEFLGWYTATSGGEKITSQKMPATAYTVYAQFKTEYYILLNDKDRNGLATNDWYEGGSTVTPSMLLNSVKTVKPAWNYTDYDYVFYLNYDSPTQSTITESGFAITARTVIVYENIAKTYTISFVMNGHGEQNSISQGYGTQVTAPANPTAIGFLFGGWFETEELTGSAYSFTTMPSGGTTLYAKWTECDHSLNTNEPTCTEGAICSICGASLSAYGHSLVSHPAVSATCTTAGNSAYWSCSRCNEYFSDEFGTIEIEANSWIIDALGHTWGAWTTGTATQHKRTCSVCVEVEYANHIWNEGIITTEPTHSQEGTKTFTCTICGETKTEIVPMLSEHVYNQEVATPTYLKSAATCAHKAIYYKSCICGERGTETFEYGDFAEHTLVHHVALVSTCTIAGNIEYWTCSVCGKYFSDADGNNEILQSETIINALGHDYVFERRVAPDFVEQTDGYDIYICSHDSAHVEHRNIVEWETLGVTINISGGSIDGSDDTKIVVSKNGSVTIKATEPEAGKRFVGWKDEEGNIVSTNEKYTFNASKAITLTAVYEDIPKGLSGGAIAGIAIACVFTTATVTYAIFWFIKKKKRL